MSPSIVNDPSYSRTSIETERRHLLSESIAPSQSTSTIDDYADGERIPRAQSQTRTSADDNSRYGAIPANGLDERFKTLANATPAIKPYRGFSSEVRYLEALREWAEDQKYIHHDTMLSGFYGKTTMEEYASRPAVEVGLRKKWKARRARKEEQKAERRKTIA